MTHTPPTAAMESQRWLPSRRGRWPRRVLLLVLVLALVGGLARWGVTGLSQWLVVADPLTHAQAIVVLGGHLPFRATEAAALYKQGWAPEVWVTQPSSPAEAAALAQLGIQVLGEEAYNRQVLERLGVPTDAIRFLRDRVQNTVGEVQRVARELKEVGVERVILVTSKSHTRRVRAVWWALVGDSAQVIVRYATEDPYDPARWWRQTREALAVSREIFGLLNVWAGFPVRQEGQ